MSDVMGIGDAPEMLAGEYVLGTLEAAEVVAAVARAATDAGFAAEIRFWESRLMPLTLLVPAVPPPASVWTRIEDTTGGAIGGGRAPAGEAGSPANDNALRWWRATAVAGLAVAAALTAFIALHPPAPLAPSRFAVLTPAGSTAPVLVAVAREDGTILVRASAAISVASDRDLQLWSLPSGAARPISLGVLPATGTRLPKGLVTGTQILVSLEPKGGSPTDLPTGPVVYGGVLQQAD